MKEAAEDKLEVGIRHFVREDGTVMNESHKELTVAGMELRQGEALQAVAGYNIKVKYHAQALLDEISPIESRGDINIMDDLLGIQLHNVEHLKCILQAIFKKAIAEPAHAETCARIAFGLMERYPEFPPENERQKPVSFIRALLAICQEEYEELDSMLTTFEASQQGAEAKFPRAEAEQAELERRKHMMLACVGFIGHLYLERLLGVQVIGQIVHDLIGIGNRGDLSPPEPHAIKCALQLLTLVGRTLDAQPMGVGLMNCFEDRLRGLSLLQHGGLPRYSAGVRLAMHDLVKWRRGAWQPRVHFEHLQ